MHGLGSICRVGDESGPAEGGRDGRGGGTCVFRTNPDRVYMIDGVEVRRDFAVMVRIWAQKGESPIVVDTMGPLAADYAVQKWRGSHSKEERNKYG